MLSLLIGFRNLVVTALLAWLGLEAAETATLADEATSSAIAKSFSILR